MEAAITRFIRGVTVADQADALSDLIKQKQLHQASKQEGFGDGVQSLARAIAADRDPVARSTAAAALLRIGGLVKGWHDRVSQILHNAIHAPLPALGSVLDPSNRYYVATFWRFAAPDWAQEYLATASIEEEGSEKVRLECLEGLVSLTPSLSATVRLLLPPMKLLSLQTEKPGDSKGRRLRRVIETTRLAFVSAGKDLGDSAGDDIATLLSDTFKNSGQPTSESVIAELAEQSLALLHELVKARFSVATSSRTYAGLAIIRGWFKDFEWEHFAEDSRSAKLVARDIVEAIEILVRAGVADDDLYRRLISATGSAQRARELSKSILVRNPGLSEDLSRWLSGSVVRQRSALATHSQALGFEEALAEVLIDGLRLLEVGEQIKRDVLPELSVMSPSTVPALERLLGLTRTTYGTVQDVARLRRITLRGTVGSLVEFSPLEQEVADGPSVGARTVRIIRPAVTAVGEDGVQRVIRKALVEPAMQEDLK